MRARDALWQMARGLPIGDRPEATPSIGIPRPTAGKLERLQMRFAASQGHSCHLSDSLGNTWYEPVEAVRYRKRLHVPPRVDTLVDNAGTPCHQSEGHWGINQC